MDRRRFLQAASVGGAAGIASRIGEQDGDGEYHTIRVPEAQPTVQAGVEADDEGDLVLVAAGTYEEAVAVETAGITLRGADRNGVVLDGCLERPNGVTVTADGVAVENVTVRQFERNAVYWKGVEGFRGSYLTAYNNGYYGIYAYRSRDGRFEYSHASGHPDAGFYLGPNRQYEAAISNVVAERNAVGYSGTSTGEDLTIRDSVRRHNRAGIVPNTLDTEDPPQRGSRIVGNVVYANDNADAPAYDLMAPTFGSGIVLWGGSDNVVAENVVGDHENFGIVAEYNVAEPSGNEIAGNVVRESGRADLALGSPAGEGNRFADNQFATSLPADIERDPGDRSGGADDVSAVFDDQADAVGAGEYESGDWREQPEPGDGPTMPDPEADPIPAAKSASWGGD